MSLTWFVGSLPGALRRPYSAGAYTVGAGITLFGCGGEAASSVHPPSHMMIGCGVFARALNIYW
jgi:hypothetical protein